MHAIEFETCYERGESYGRSGHEPDRLEVWVCADDYKQLQQLESALTLEQALELAENYLLITFSDDELREIAAQAAEYPTEAAIAAHILHERKPYLTAALETELPAPTQPAQAPSGLSNAPGKRSRKWLLGLLVLAAVYLAAYLWLN